MQVQGEDAFDWEGGDVGGGEVPGSRDARELPASGNFFGRGR